MTYQIPSFEEAKVLVVGDIMLDRYWFGKTERISPEAPIPVVHVQKEDERPGGAGNVALNLAALGTQAILSGVVGKDNAAQIIESKLQAANIASALYKDGSKPTTTKLRIVSQNQQLIRCDFEENFSTIESSNLKEIFKSHLQEVKVVILSDYGKGALQGQTELIDLAKNQGIPVLVDPKGSDFSIYRGASLITPNLKEFEAVVGPCRNENEFVERGMQLLEEYNFGSLLVTRGAKGMTLLRRNEPELHLPAKAKEVYDVTGAGDTVIATIAAALAVNLDLASAVAIANRAAGIVVGKLGAATVSMPELRRAIHEDKAMDKGVMTEDQLAIIVNDAKAHGEKVVMTNGCFDILHAGHVSYLEKAKQLGDRLIIAVNDDDSVAKLKGANRPINALDRRMAVLAGLASVDWVVPFSEDTPERIITHLSPNILVKGGDYEVEEIAGHQHVLGRGGEVKVLNFEEGCSSSAIISKIKEEVEV